MTFIPVRSVIDKQLFEHVYQPLWNLMNWSIFGYESLLRVNGVKNIEQFFQKAREEGCLYELDLISLESSISQFPFLEQKRGLLFVNVYPSTISRREFAQLLKKWLNVFHILKTELCLSSTKQQKTTTDGKTAN